MPKFKYIRELKLLGLSILGLSSAITVLLAGVVIGEGVGFYGRSEQLALQQINAANSFAMQQCSVGAVALQDMRKCVWGAARSAREEIRSQQNQRAESNASDWAWWSMIAALIQLPISVGGLVFVGANLRQVQRALNHSHSADSAHLIPCPTLVQKYGRCHVSFSNEGKTIAFILGVQVTATDHLPKFGDWRKGEDGFTPNDIPMKAGEVHPVVSLPMPTAAAKHIIGKIDYIDVFEVRRLAGFRYDHDGKTWKLNRLHDWCFMRVKTDQDGVEGGGQN